MAERHLIILGIRGVPAGHGGFETFAARLALWMVELGWKVTVYCQGSETGRREEDWWEGVRRIHIPVRRDGAVGTIEFDVKSTRDALRLPGLILTLGYNTGFLSAWLRMRGRTNLINMDGLEWKRDKYPIYAQAYLWLNERLAARSGNRLIADHPAIADHLATRVERSRIVTIAYGADSVVEADIERLEALGLEPGGYFTLIARPEPENSVLEMVRAFSERSRGAKIALLGRYDRSQPYQKSVLDAASSEIAFVGPIYDKPTLDALRLHSIAYLHGHRVGGTNPSLVEALGAGNAVIAHDNPFNRWVAGDAGLYFDDQAMCARHIDALIADPALRERLRGAARTRWTEAFRWPMILKAYQTLLEQNVTP